MVSYLNYFGAPVKYEAVGFLQKHKDTLLPDLSDSIRSTKSNLIQEILKTKLLIQRKIIIFPEMENDELVP